jgi:POT family proton-dependent oligopeptide transporter
MSTPYRIAPIETNGIPAGIPYIVGNEAAERFSFYGMKTILVVFMTQYLLSAQGQPNYMTDTQAREWMHLFVASAYFFPVIGAIIADAFLGKYVTILALSMVYCAGHLCLALIDLPSGALAATLDPKGWMVAGLVLIAIGSGGIKPCVSAHVGDQFGHANKHLIEKIFGWFYFAINFGSFFSTLLTPWLLKNYGAGWAFGVPGILMALATLVFWMGRNKFTHIQPRGLRYFGETFGMSGLKSIFKLVPLYLFVAMFWSLYDQGGSAWVEQAQQMNLDFIGIIWLESQVQAINPLLILIYIPLFAYVIYPLASKVFKLTPLRKILIGFALTVVSFSIAAYAQGLIEKEEAHFDETILPMVLRGDVDVAATCKAMRLEEHNACAVELETVCAQPQDKSSDKPPYAAMAKPIIKAGVAVLKDGSTQRANWPTVGWQLLAYMVITAAEVLVSITCLEFSYTQAPPQMKSLIMSFSLLSVSLGNLFTAAVNRFTMDANGNSTLVGANYYWFFTKLMIGATVLFIFVVVLYKPREYLQDDPNAAPAQ